MPRTPDAPEPLPHKRQPAHKEGHRMNTTTTTAERLRAAREFARAPYAWPGGYPKVLIFTDGQIGCAGCARDNYRTISQHTRDGYRDGWSVEGVDLHMEGPPLLCACCDAPIESAYGDDTE